MSRSTRSLAAALLVVTAALAPLCVATAPAGATPAGDRSPGIAAVYPNPVADGDRGEFVVLSVPEPTDLSGYVLTDGEDRLALPNATAEGRVVLSPDPELARNRTEGPVYRLEGLSLANGGERLRLRRGNRTVDALRYEDAPESEVGRPAGGGLAWRPLGATNRSVVTARGGTAEAFLLPDSPGVPLGVLRNASDRVLLAGYTLTSRRVVDALVAAHRRGVDVRVLLEGEPIGGIPRRQAAALDRLTAAGVAVRLLGGPHSRYAYHHAKYAVADDRAVVLTENWKPAGVGGRSSRGWGVVLSQRRVVAALADTFRADAGWRDARPWRTVRRGRTFERAFPANGSYPTRYPSERVRVAETRLLLAPDNARRALVRELDAADRSIDVIGMSLAGRDSRLTRALVRAAERGVEVRVLLSGAWYVREENGRLVERLRAFADRRDLPLEARLAEPAGRYEKIHAKGAVVDGETVLLGSLNWNGHAATENREVVVALSGEEVGDYYQRAFDRDWAGGRGGTPLPVGWVAAVAGAVVLCALVARRVEFGADAGVGVGPE